MNNNTISLSLIIIIYEIIILSLYSFNKKFYRDLLSWPIILNFFIIYVMFLTDCNVDAVTKTYVALIKVLLLFIVLYLGKLNFRNYSIGLLFLLVYYLCSNINIIYSCDVNIKHLLHSLLFSTLTYFINVM